MKRGASSLIVAGASAALLVVALAARNAPLPAPAATAAAEPNATASFEPAAPAAPEPSATVTEPADRGELDCSIADRGDGPYQAHQLEQARLFVPAPPPAEEYDLLLHFHGGEAVRKLIAPEALGLVIATVDAGQGSKRYAAALAGPKALDALLATVDEKLAPAKLRHLLISSWSAGYGAVRELLAAQPSRARAFVLLDSVHTSYAENGEALDQAGLDPFFGLAKRAAAGEQLMVLTHSAITPPGYASTSEVAAAIIAHVGGRRRYGGLAPAFGVELKTRFDRADLHVRGYTGTGKPAHCAHLELLPAILRDEVLPFLSR